MVVIVDDVAGTPATKKATLTNLTKGLRASSTTLTGVIECATGAETNTGTDATRAVTPDGLDDWTGSAQITTTGVVGVPTVTKADDYTAVLGDAGKMITYDKGTAVTGTIPANASVAYAVDTELHFCQLGAGALTIAITSDTLNVESSLTLVLAGQYAVATAKKITATTWILFGNLTAS